MALKWTRAGVSGDRHSRSRTAWAPLLHRGNQRRPTLADFTACIDHVIELVGPQHVGIGTDLCDDLTPTPESWGAVHGPKGTFPEISGNIGDWYAFDTNIAEGIDTIFELPNLVRALTARSYSPDALDGILGGNILRVFEEATA